MQTVKTCTKCGEMKPLDGFQKQKGGKYGVTSRCKTCASNYQRRYRKENSEKIRRHYEKNREKIAERKRRYYKENREQRLEYQRRYIESNRERVAEKDRHYYEMYGEVIKAKVAKRQREARHLTEVFATAPRQAPYLPAEDALILADNGMTIYQKAIELGRTHKSVSSRRARLLSRLNI